ncbi:MAG: pseudouridine synthase [Benjaminiella poitrasii]|nr:MAG: pseudouridine synthase [Benjaminiella poitrasii]
MAFRIELNALTRWRIMSARTFCTHAPCFNVTMKRSEQPSNHIKSREVDLTIKTNVPEDESLKCHKPKKIKTALLLGYNGSEYSGMQTNPGVKTIEGELFEAVCKAGYVSKMNSDNPKKIQLLRAARTDKGVHAFCNVVSLKMICLNNQVAEKINAFLPSDIRVWGHVETLNSFNAKDNCDSRIYEYLLPSYALQDLTNKDWSDVPKSDRDIQIPTKDSNSIRYKSPTNPQKLLEYRVDIERFNKFNEAINSFKGTHNYHNYTKGKIFEHKAANRYIIQIDVEKPKIIEGMEWISVKIHGQSFMIHQIRKMIAMAILCVRTNTPLSIIPKTFEKNKINIPKAPALGLLLDRPVFQCYNKRVKEEFEGKKAIDFDLYKDEIEQFKRKSIYDNIFNQERKHQIFDTFLITTSSHIETDYIYFNKEGVIP